MNMSLFIIQIVRVLLSNVIYNCHNNEIVFQHSVCGGSRESIRTPRCICSHSIANRTISDRKHNTILCGTYAMILKHSRQHRFYAIEFDYPKPSIIYLIIRTTHMVFLNGPHVLQII